MLHKIEKYVRFVFLFSLILLCTHLSLAQKTDTIIHVNGNILTGDLKKMNYGAASWKMDGMGTINFEQVKINTIRSKKKFEIKMKDGQIFYGSFDTSNFYRKVYVLGEKDQFLLDIDNIVEIYPLKNSFWRRLSAKFSLGGNYSKGSNIFTLNFSGNINYRKRKSYFEFSVSDNNTYQEGELSSSKSDAIFSWQRLLKNGWSSGFELGANQNTELGNKLRIDINAIAIKDLNYNIWNRLYAAAGLSIAQERSYSDTPDQTDLAGIFQVVWKIYRNTSPKIWLDSDISFIPYLTENNRYRMVFNLNPSLNLFSDDFKIGFNFYYNYDSKPPAGALSKDDYAFNLEISYSLH